ncbi:hypothetical protein [Komagataeibacter europaeus]|uniref:hypothetical protein n=1 Tax=Komagataeibacter europaeus TaxID=33995 RepID=UPI0002DDE415|nr:hypothetical protein [Komagataeibacter europaeus]
MSRNHRMHESRTRNTVLQIICNDPGTAEPVSHSLDLAACAPAPTETGSRRSLARILHPGNSHDIPFQGHGERLDALRQWMADTTRDVSVQIITGRPGQGKTRLGTELAARAREDGWMAGFLPPGNAGIFPDAPFTTVWQQPTLVIIDNAASRATQVKTWLRALVRQPCPAHPLRLVLLERAGLDTLWVNEIFSPDHAADAALPALLSPAQWPDLPPLTGADARYAVFAAAYRATSGSAPPLDTAMMLRHKLDELAREGSTLFLIALGFVAAREGLLAARTLGIPSLLSRMVKEEIRRIEALWQADGGMPEDMRPQAWALTGISALCGGMDAATLRQVAQAEAPASQPDAPARMEACLHALRMAQPGCDGGTAVSLPGMVAGALGMHLVMSQGMEILDRLPATPSLRLPLVAGTVRACQAAWEIGDNRPLAWLEHLTGLCVADHDALLALARHLPRQGTRIQAIALDVAERLTASLRADGASAPSAPLGRALTALFHRHADLWQPEQARHAAHEAMAVQTALAARDPACRPAAAASLHDIARYDNGLDAPAAAQPMARQAVAAYTTLAEDDPATFRPYRARSLYQVARAQHDLDQPMAARRTLRRAIAIQTRLADVSPVTFQPDLAASLLLLSSCQASLRAYEEARETALEAVILYTALAHDYPDTFQPALADSLHQLASHQLELSQDEAALKSMEEAVSLQFAFTERRQDAGLPELAAYLVTLTRCHGALGRVADRHHTLREAIRLYRILAEKGPDIFRLPLARELERFNMHSSPTDPALRVENMQAMQEVADLYGTLAQTDPKRFTPRQAHILTELSQRQERWDQHDEAIASGTAAVRLYMDLTLKDPDQFHEAMLEAFRDVAGLLMGDRTDDCLSLLRDVLALYRDIVARNPDNLQMRMQLATLLLGQTVVTLELGLPEQIYAPWHEGLGMMMELAALRPGTFADELKRVLSDLENTTREDSPAKEVYLALWHEAIDDLTSLVQQHPAIFTPVLIGNLEKLSRQLLVNGQPEQALQAIQRAISVHHGRMDKQIIDDCQRHVALARSMDILAYIYKTLDQYDDMRRVAEAIIAIYQQLIDRGEEGLEWELAKKYSVLGMCQMHLAQTKGSLASTTSAISRFRRLIEQDTSISSPGLGALEPALAANLARASSLHDTLGQHAAALQAVTEAIDLYSRLARQEPADFSAPLAECLRALPRLRQAATGRDDSMADTLDAVELYRTLADAYPEQFLPDLACFLVRLCTCQWQGGVPAWADALESAQEAAAIYARLYASDPDRHRAGYADSLYKTFLCHNGLEQLDQARVALKEALSLYRILVTDHPQEFRPQLAQCLLDLAQYLITYKDYDMALHTVHEATSLLTDLAQTDRATFQPVLKKARAMHGLIVRKRSR